ncbi:hypothetical protein JCM9279_006721 [Rhodotorula babjevae]
MINKVPKQSDSWVGSRAIKHLVVDTAPLVTAPVSSLRNTAAHYLVTPDVVHELRDKRGRNVLDEAKLQLPADTLVDGQEPDELHRAREGFEVREPSAESVARITSFARKTGDLAVLSSADIRVLALCLTIELEENGTWRVREFPGQQLTGPPKEDKKDEPAAAGEAQVEDKEGEAQVEDKGKGKEEKAVAPTSGVDELAGEVEALKVDEAASRDEPAAEAATTDAGDAPAPASSTASASSAPAPAPAPSSAPAPTATASTSNGADDADDAGDVSDAESDSSAGSWITPDNVHDHQVRDLGLFESAEAQAASAHASTSRAQQPKPKTIMKAAVLTGDFAMQNVALQMGLNVLGSGGKRVREVRTWVLRCHACFKLCKNPDKRFCPSCGGATLLRTSITYVPVSPQHPQGYILHLKANFNYRLRGTQFSMANPKMGKAGGGVNAEMVVREDQKEWVRGVKSAEIRRDKEQRALQKSVLDDEKRGKRSGPAGSSAGWFAEAGSLEAQMLGIGGGKGGVDNPKGRRRGGKNGAGGEVRLDKMGLPIIGSGRRNPNEARRRK